METILTPELDKKQLFALAQAQKQVLAVFVISLVAAILLIQEPLWVSVLVFVQAASLTHLAFRAKSSVPWLYAILGFVPIINFLALIHVNGKATSLLKHHGVRVGILGARV